MNFQPLSSKLKVTRIVVFLALFLSVCPVLGPINRPRAWAGNQPDEVLNPPGETISVSVDSGKLIMGGGVFNPPFTIESDGYLVSIGGKKFSRFVSISNRRMKRQLRLAGDSWEPQDLFWAAADSIAKLRFSGVEDLEAKGIVGGWIEGMLAKKEYSGLKFHFPDDEDAIIVEGMFSGREVGYLIPSRGDFAKDKGPKNFATISEIQRFLEEDKLVAWGSEYLKVYSGENARLLLELLSEVNSGKRRYEIDKLAPGFTKYSGIKVPNFFIRDISVPETYQEDNK